MKPTQGLNRDHKILEMPEGNYPFAKNGILTGNKQALQNELGFRLSPVAIPYTVIGVIKTDEHPIIVSSNDVYSAIGFYNQTTDTYIPILDDKDLGYKLGYKRSHPVEGESRRNYLNHIEIVLLDGLNPIRLFDTAKLPDSLREYLLFPEFGIPEIKLDTFDGGNVLLGAYYAAVKYLNADGTETRYVTASYPIFATSKNFGSIPGFSSGKSIKVSLSNVDTDYDFLQVAIIKKIKGITTAVELDKVPTGDTVEVFYSGNEGEDITLEEVLIPAAFYQNANTVTQLQDVLWLADIKEAAPVDMQKYANLIKIKWQSTYIDDLEANEDIKSGKIRTFKHGEVIDPYVVYYYKNGQMSDAFHIPGPEPLPEHLEADLTALGQGVEAKKFQTNTLGMIGIDTATKSGYTGVWVNADETYPSTDSFDSEGLDLRGVPVRHHKLPTLQQVATLFYSKEPGYGVTGLDALGIKPENVIIPVEMQDKIIGYEIFYAKRSFSNSTVISGGLVLNAAMSSRTGKDYYFTGGNWHSNVADSDGSRSEANITRTLSIPSSNSIFKTHHPDLMYNKPAIIPSLQVVNFKLQVELGLKSLIRDEVDETNMEVDYLLKGKRLNATYGMKGIKESGYLANNASKGDIKNIKSEDGFGGTYLLGGFLTDKKSRIVRARDTGDPEFPEFEQSYNVDYLSIKKNMYLGFSNQELVRTGVIHPIAGIPTVWAYSGDCFLVVHSYVSYGLSNSLDRFPVNPGEGTDGLKGKGFLGIGGEEMDTYTDEYYRGTSGGKNVRRYVTESIYNLWQRYEDDAIPESKFYTASGKDFVNLMDRNKDNNFIALSQEANSVGNVLNGIEPFSIENLRITDSPYKVVSSNRQVKEAKFNSWKNFNPLDYYEADKNMGKIVNIQGMGDKLIIHHKNALYITRDIATLKSDVLSITLGSGDIFRIPPQQGRPSESGFAGTQHKFACTMTDYGYVFPDGEAGVVYVLNEDGLNSLNNDMNNFFMTYLNVKEDNPFIGNGICIGYDREFQRILLTVKNRNIPNFVPGYEETEEFFSKLTPGVSVVLRDGRYQLFKGLNSSPFDCEVFTNPSLPDYEETIPEFSVEGFLVGTVQATGGTPGYSYVIVSGNTNNAFTLDSITGNLIVSNSKQLDMDLQESFTLVIKVIDSKGNIDTGTFIVNLEAVDLPPVTTDYTIEVEEFLPIDTEIQQIESSDPRGLILTHTLESQSVAGAVKVSSSGMLSVNLSSAFVISNPIITVVVRVTNSAGLYVFSNITLIMLKVNRPPVGYDKTVTILDTLTGVVMDYDKPTDPDEASEGLKQSVVSQTVPGMFEVNTQLNRVTLNPEFTLDPEEGPYVIQMKVEDNGDPTLSDTFTLTIHVLYDPTTLISEPYNAACDNRIIFEVIDYFVFEYVAENTDIVDVNQTATNYGSFYININAASPINPSGAVAPIMQTVFAKKAAGNTVHKNSNFLNFKKIRETYLDIDSLPTSVFISSGCTFTAIDKEDILKIKVKGYIGGTMFETADSFDNVGGLLKVDIDLERWLKYSGGMINIVYVKNDRENFLQFQ